MRRWIVLEMDRIDVRTYQSNEPEYAPGDYISGGVVSIGDLVGEQSAISAYADGRPGFFSALPLPVDLEIHQTVSQVVGVGGTQR